MCVVSMVHDHYFPNDPTSPWTPYRITQHMTTIRMAEYLELVRKAAEYDRITEQKDCIKPEYEHIKKCVEEILKEKSSTKQTGLQS